MRIKMFKLPIKSYQLKCDQKQKMVSAFRSAGIIFCFVLFLPYIITVFWRGIEEADKFSVLTGPEIMIYTEKGTESIPMDEYLCGILAQYYENGYTREELKALSIILRTNLLHELEKHGNIVQDFWNYQERRSRWGSNFAAYEADLKKIIEETAGQVLLLEGKIQKITISEFNHDNTTWQIILQNEYADYAIYHYF